MSDTFNTPILLMTFNRPKHTREVFAELKKQRPKRLFVFQDAPRVEHETDREKCAAVREIFGELLSWDCELETYYSDRHLGCGRGPAAAITWFFGRVEQGIIFEDDCLPSETLFRFYAALLDKYKDDHRISLITANNLKLRWKSAKQSYVFATVGAATMGSWAGWARAWRMFDYDISVWKDCALRQKIAGNLIRKKYYEYYADIFDSVCGTKQVDIWDYQWFFARILHGTVSIVSTVNQVSNIGFGAESTHAPDPNNRIANLPVYPALFPLVHPRFRIDRLFDWVVFNRYYFPQKKSFFLRVALKTIESVFCR